MDIISAHNKMQLLEHNRPLVSKPTSRTQPTRAALPAAGLPPCPQRSPLQGPSWLGQPSLPPSPFLPSQPPKTFPHPTHSHLWDGQSPFFLTGKTGPCSDRVPRESSTRSLPRDVVRSGPGQWAVEKLLRGRGTSREAFGGTLVGTPHSCLKCSRR